MGEGGRGRARGSGRGIGRGRATPRNRAAQTMAKRAFTASGGGLAYGLTSGRLRRGTRKTAASPASISVGHFSGPFLLPCVPRRLVTPKIRLVVEVTRRHPMALRAKARKLQGVAWTGRSWRSRFFSCGHDLPFHFFCLLPSKASSRSQSNQPYSRWSERQYRSSKLWSIEVRSMNDPWKAKGLPREQKS